MNQYVLVVLAFVGGVFLAMQGGLNAHLGVILKNPLMASAVAFFSSLVFAFICIVVSVRDVPNLSELKEVPVYLWFTGGLCSVIGVSIYYYTIPKLGIATMISLGLCGQLVFSLFAGQFGWLNLPIEPMTLKRIIGVVSMSIGIILITIK
ncbi:DMT family transporter [Aquimarina aquimarini]|uniref:DMT family transporter n=1 Tax=Aquimarina aquimarini TaxID=1191734 RepID=UPI000D55E478|nr:DMT family transporter [Aquimarina aquimarini]